MPIGIFSASVALLILVAYRKRIALVSPYGVFVAFQILYNVVPVVISRLSSSNLTLLGDPETVDTQILLAASGNICFALVYLLFYKRTITILGKPEAQSNRNRLLFWIFMGFVITCIVSMKYGWNAQAHVISDSGGEPAGVAYALASYVKSGFVAAYLYYIYRFGLDRWSWILLGCHAVVAFLDGARTTFLPIFLLTLFLFQAQTTNKRTRRHVYLAAVLGVLIAIGARALIIRDDSLLVKMATPVTVEGLMGSYPSLQSIYALEQESHPKLTFGASYVIDPLLWFVPQGDTRNKYLFLQSWVNDSSAWLREDFAPMGGFYYVAEAVAAFSYVGPAIVTIVYALSLVWIERNANKHRLLYLTWMPTIGLLFVKMIFGNVFKLFVVDFAFVGLFVLIHRARLFLGRSGNDAVLPSDLLLHGFEQTFR